MTNKSPLHHQSPGIKCKAHTIDPDAFILEEKKGEVTETELCHGGGGAQHYRQMGKPTGTHSGTKSLRTRYFNWDGGVLSWCKCGISSNGKWKEVSHSFSKTCGAVCHHRSRAAAVDKKLQPSLVFDLETYKHHFSHLLRFISCRVSLLVESILVPGVQFSLYNLPFLDRRNGIISSSSVS